MDPEEASGSNGRWAHDDDDDDDEILVNSPSIRRRQLKL